jgi:hypothetical protein
MQQLQQHGTAVAEADLLGRDVHCVGGVVVGRIRALRRCDGALTHVVVSLGSFPRLGEDRRAVPVEALSDEPGGLGLACSVDLLRSAPMLRGPSCWDDPQFCRRLAEHFSDLG